MTDVQAAPITTGVAAKLMGVPTHLLANAAEWDIVPHLGRKGANYLHDPATLPDAATVIRGVRERYKAQLEWVVVAAETAMAHVEAVQLDALEALDAGVDPVQPLGADTRDFMGFSSSGESGSRRALTQLRDACLELSRVHRHLIELDIANQTAQRALAVPQRARVFPPGTQRPPGHRRGTA